MWWTFIFGLLIGLILGVFVMAILYSGREMDKQVEKDMAEMMIRKGGNVADTCWTRYGSEGNHPDWEPRYWPCGTMKPSSIRGEACYEAKLAIKDKLLKEAGEMAQSAYSQTGRPVKPDPEQRINPREQDPGEVQRNNILGYLEGAFNALKHLNYELDQLYMEDKMMFIKMIPDISNLEDLKEGLEEWQNEEEPD